MDEETRRLPPFDDDLVDASKKPFVILFLRRLKIPPERRAEHLRRWAKVTGAWIGADDFAEVERDW